MSHTKKLLIALAAFIFLGLILSTPLTDLGHFSSRYDRLSEQDELLDMAELNSFLRVWSEMLSKDVGRYASQQLSLSRGTTEDGFPPQLVRWLKRQGWHAGRFFDDEQKIRALVRYAALEQNLNANRKLLQELGKDAGAASGLREIISRQERQLSVLKVNPQELELIRANLYQVGEILAGKAVLKD